MNKKIVKIIKKTQTISIYFFAISMIFGCFLINDLVSSESGFDDTGLVGYWSFDEGSGSVASDSSSYGNDGTIYGASWVDGVSGNALSFDGTDDYVLIPDSDELDPVDDFSCEFWVYFQEGVEGGHVFTKHYTFIDNDYSWYAWVAGYPGQGLTSQACFTNTDGGFNTLYSNSDIGNLQWKHVVFTFEDTTNDLKIYIDGQLDNEGSVDIDIRNTGQDLYIGTRPHPNANDQPYLHGMLDELRLYSRVLTPSEVYEHFDLDIQVSNQKPTVSITSPVDDSTVSGTVSVTGTSDDTDGSVQYVQFRVNTAAWVTVSGTSSWSYSFDTTSLTNTVHSLSVRSFDGEDYSDITTIDVTIDNTVSEGLFSPTDPVAYWSFDTGVGSTAYDESENDNDGSITGASWITGKKDSALDFDGEDDYVLVSDSDELDLTDDFTVELWIYPHDVGRGESSIWYYNQQWIVCKHKAFINGDGSWGIANPMEEYDFQWGYQGTDGFGGPSDIQNDQWTHLAYTYDDSQNVFSLYVNGVLDNQETKDYNIQNTVRDLYIGCEEYNPIWHVFDGLLDEIVIYDRVLQPSEFWGLNYLEDMEPENVIPTVTINSLTGSLSDNVMVSGNAYDSDGTIQSVDIRVDSGSWMSVSGTSSWSYNWDTTVVTDGLHMIYARSYDGEDYSDIESIQVSVDNTDEIPSEDQIDPVGYWNFNTGYGETAFDQSGNDNHGVIDGASWVNGISGNALSFDGVDDYVLIADSDELELTDDFTLEFWLNTYDNVGRLPVVSKHTSVVDNDYSWTTFIEGDSTFNFENTPGWHHLISDSIIEENQWTHVVVTFIDSSNDMRFYFNGALEKQGYVDIDIRNNDKDFIIGTQPHPSRPQDQRFFEGLLDEIKLYNRALSESEVLEHYNSVEVANERPSVSISQPSDSATVSGSVSIAGTASDSDGSVQKVEFRVNTASWITVTGTSSWNYVLDTTSLANSVHTISVRSYDGEDYSDVSSVEVNVNNEDDQGSAKLDSPDDPVAYWDFDTGSGTTAYDRSVNNNDGAINGANWIDGKRNNALEFDGEESYILVTDSDELDLTGDFTIEMWVYPHDIGRGTSDDWYHGQQWLLGKHKAFVNGDGSWGISNTLERYDFHWDYQGTDGIDGTNDIQNNEWTHLAYTYDDSQNIFTMYVNGNIDVQVSKNYNIQNTDHDLYIGCEEYNPYWHTYDGLIDEIVIYDKVLEPSEFWGLNYDTTVPDQEDSSESTTDTPGFTTTTAVASIAAVGALIAFFRRSNRNR